jgi:hypothetical protein
MTAIRVLLLAAALANQSGTGSQPATPSDGAVVRGTVTAAATGQGLRRARVLLLPAADHRGGTRIAANTNAAGRFEVRDVPPGRYHLSASRAGYVGIEYGQHHPLERGLTITVPAGGVLERMDLALPGGGVLAGRVIDDLGEPYPGVQVIATVLRYDAGARKAFPSGSGTTDDLGQFRIAGLGPGDYSVVAISNETWRAEDKQTWGYAATLHPPPSGDRAGLVRLGPSEQRTAIVIPMSAGRTARIRGTVRRENGDPVPNAAVPLNYGYGTFVLTAGARMMRTDASGAFDFRDVPAGRYIIGGGQGQPITVAGVDLDDVRIVARTGSTVLGSLTTDEGVPPPFPVSGVRILMEAPYGNVLPTLRVVQVNTDWSFKLGSLGGPFLFRVLGLPDEWTLGSVRLDDKDISDVPFDVPTGGREIRGMQVVLTRKIGRVAGSVTDPAGKPAAGCTVVVFSEDPAHWVPYSRYIKAARPSPDGQFSISGLPPGTYRALALDLIERGEWEDREWLERMRDAGARVVLAEGGTQTLRLTTGG